MAERSDPFSEFLGIVSGPISSVVRSFDNMRKGADEVLKGLQNFNATMENLNETASAINRLLADIEEPVRAAVPQITRTIKLTEEWTDRLAGPIDQVVPGIARLADTLNSPVFGSLPTDLGDFIDVINDLAKRMAPLGSLAEQAGSLFGAFRIPGLSPRPPVPAPSTPPAPPAPVPEPVSEQPAAPTAPKKPAAKKTAVKKTPAKKTSAKKQVPAKRPTSAT